MTTRPRIKITQEDATVPSYLRNKPEIERQDPEPAPEVAQPHRNKKIKKSKKQKSKLNNNNHHQQQAEQALEAQHNHNAAEVENDQQEEVQNQEMQDQEVPRSKRAPKLSYLAVCIPDSIISIPQVSSIFINQYFLPFIRQSSVLRAYLLSEIARICSVFMVDEIIVMHDYTYTSKSQQFSPSEYVVRNLQYLETPQYLRKHLFELHSDLKNAGLMNPLECHHHLRADQVCKYREGVVIDRPVKEGCGSWVDIGLRQQAKIDYVLPAKTRVTVKIDNFQQQNPKFFEGKAVSRSTPRQEEGLYWGYNVRFAHNLKSVFKSDLPYDRKILINHHETDLSGLPKIGKFGRHSIPQGSRVLLFFSGYEPLESIVENDEGCKLTMSEVIEEFDYRFEFGLHGVKQLRTEEQLFIVLNKLHGAVDRL